MDNMGFLVASVVIGTVVLGAVVWKFVRNAAQQNIILSTTLSLIGFTLVSSPLWTSIAIKGPQWELTLLREQSEDQVRNFLQLLEAYEKAVPPEKAAALSPRVKSLRSSVEQLEQTPKQADEDRLKLLEEVLMKMKTTTEYVVAEVKG